MSEALLASKNSVLLGSENMILLVEYHPHSHTHTHSHTDTFTHKPNQTEAHVWCPFRVGITFPLKGYSKIIATSFCSSQRSRTTRIIDTSVFHIYEIFKISGKIESNVCERSFRCQKLNKSVFYSNDPIKEINTMCRFVSTFVLLRWGHATA